jgi:hypothetical protein
MSKHLKRAGSASNFNPIRETFRDISRWKLVCSVWRVFWRIYSLQGWSGAVRVLPIVWTIICAVRGFAKYHAEEHARMETQRAAGIDLEEAILSGKEYEEYRQLGAWLRDRLHSLGPTFIKIGQTLSTRADAGAGCVAGRAGAVSHGNCQTDH